jgi:O-antigen/teichoic acid export membrane protein
VGFIADRETRKLSRLDVDVLKENLKFALPILPATLLSWFAFSIDRISLRQYSSFKELGLYSAAFKVVSIMSLVQAGFTSFWIPVAYEKFEVHGDDSKSFFKRANQIVSFVMFSFGFLILIFKDIIFLFFSKSYREASTIVPFLIFQPVMNTISETTVLGINLTKKTHWHTVIMGITCFANFIGNQILVPIFGARGAAISTGLSYVLFFTLRTAIAERLYPIKFDLKRIYTGILILFVVALSGTFLESSSVFFLLSFIGMLFVLFIYKNEFTLLKEQLKKLVKRKSTF